MYHHHKSYCFDRNFYRRGLQVEIHNEEALGTNLGEHLLKCRWAVVLSLGIQ